MENERRGALASVAQLVGALSHSQKAAGSITGQDRYNPQSRHMWEATN